jgi:hypothetical protein
MGALCDYTYRCAGLAGWQVLGASSYSECVSLMSAQTCSNGGSYCDIGKTYHPEFVDSCVSAFATASCSQSGSPVGCDSICQ